MTVVLAHDEADLEATAFIKNHQVVQKGKMSRKRKKPVCSGDGVGVITRLLADMSNVPATVPLPVTEPCRMTVTVHRMPVYIKGRYLKLQRGLSQTPWVLDGKRIGASSVSETIAEPFLAHFQVYISLFLEKTTNNELIFL